nr:siderophore ABC transporter substrate-binding protein [Carnobacterium gallinarum]
MCLVAFALVVAACGATGTDKKDASSTANSSSKTIEAKTVKVKDENGEVEVPKNPQRVVVFDMGMLDTINALGEGDKVVGVAKDNLPKYLSKFKEDKFESAGGIKEPDFEKINSLKPDLIIISGRQSDALEELQKIAPTLYLSTDSSDIWNSIQKNVSTIGTIFDKSDDAKKQLDTLSDKIATVNKKASGSDVKTLTVLLNEGSLSAYGKGSRFAILNDVFGFKLADETIKSSTHGQSVTYEYILEKDPDVLFVIDRTKAIGGDTSKNGLTDNELVQKTKAAKNDKIVMLSSDIWYLSGGGLESTKLMLDEVSKVVE